MVKPGTRVPNLGTKPGKPELVPAAAGAEPSEPSEVRPEEKPREQLVGAQEENPQVVAHRAGAQAADSEGEWPRQRPNPGNGGTEKGHRVRRGGERLEGREGTLDHAARDGFAGGGKRDRGAVKSRL